MFINYSIHTHHLHLAYVESLRGLTNAHCPDKGQPCAKFVGGLVQISVLFLDAHVLQNDYGVVVNTKIEK